MQKRKLQSGFMLALILASVITALALPVRADNGVNGDMVNVKLDPVFSAGKYPEWKQFIIENNGLVNIYKITVTLPAAVPAFRPVEYIIETDPETPENGWKISYNVNDRLIEFMSLDPTEYYIPPRGTGIAQVKFEDGPSDETNAAGYEFIVTVSDGHAFTFYLKQYIDKKPPAVQIKFPAEGFAFVKKADGNIYVQMPNNTVKNIRLLWVNGTANDSPNAANPNWSGIDRVEIWVRLVPDGIWTYLGDANLKPQAPEDPGFSSQGPETVSWWFSFDPTKLLPPWVPERYYEVKAWVFDRSVVNDNWHDKPSESRIRMTNNAYATVTAFWFTETRIEIQLSGKPLKWVPGNGRIDVNGTTGFYPNDDVSIYLENTLFNAKILLRTVKADNLGRFLTTIYHLPEVPRSVTNANPDWTITAVDKKGNTASDKVSIIPWITYENTIPQDDPKVWVTTAKGNVGGKIKVYGHGFLPSRQTKWDPFSTVYVKIYYTDVPPLVNWVDRTIWNGTSQYSYDKLTWNPKLTDKLLAEVATDANGYWSAEMTIPQSYGGLHGIYAVEDRVVTDIGKAAPSPAPDLTRSGWPKITGIEQAIVFDVWPTIGISPSTVIPEQYVTITVEGLPLPKYYKLLKNDKVVQDTRDWCLVLDFGPHQGWVFENQHIRNNEFDDSWRLRLWYPFSYGLPDPRDHLESPVWAGKLSSVTFDYATERHYHNTGSRFLQVPVLTPDDYDVMVYYFDKRLDAFTHDHDASTSVNLIKDPLNVHVQTTAIHFPSEMATVLVKTDVDGAPDDVSALTLNLYLGNSFIRELTYTRVELGLYIATFTVPKTEGDYFVVATATKTFEEIVTLKGVATAGFAVNPTLNGFDAKLKALDSKVATLETTVGEVKVSVEDLEARVIALDGKVATIETRIGTITSDVSSIQAKIVSVEGKILTIQTSLGTIDTSIRSINLNGDTAGIVTDLGTIKGKVTSMEDDIATIITDMGTVRTKTDSIKGDTGLQPVALGLSVIAAIGAIAAAVLILRKVYSK